MDKENNEQVPRREYLAKLRAYRKALTQSIVTTRFSASTWEENANFRKMHKNIKCIYCTPTPITKNIPTDNIMFVLEMNNTANKIMGIGLVRNHPYSSKYIPYSNMNYNRYNYVGKMRIDREEMTDSEKDVLNKLDQLCFFGNSHMKRGHGISLLSLKLLYKHKDEINFHESIRQMFKKRMEEKNI